METIFAFSMLSALAVGSIYYAYPRKSIKDKEIEALREDFDYFDLPVKQLAATWTVEELQGILDGVKHYKIFTERFERAISLRKAHDSIDGIINDV